MGRKTIIAVGALALAALGATVLAQNAPVETRPPITPYKPAFSGQTRAPEQKLNVAFDQITVAEGLSNPWAIAFLPDRRIIMTEKAGGIRIIGTDGKVSEPVTGGPTVVARGQGGLLDVALDPAFATNRLVYFSFSEAQADGTNNTAVARGRLVEAPTPHIEGIQTIYHQSPSWNSSLHFGSRLVFARDGKLFITQGERSNDPPRDQAQDLNSLLGKIVRTDEWTKEVAQYGWENDYMNSADSRKFLERQHEELKGILGELGLAK